MPRSGRATAAARIALGEIKAGASLFDMDSGSRRLLGPRSKEVPGDFGISRRCEHGRKKWAILVCDNNLSRSEGKKHFCYYYAKKSQIFPKASPKSLKKDDFQSCDLSVSHLCRAKSRALWRQRCPRQNRRPFGVIIVSVPYLLSC